MKAIIPMHITALRVSAIDATNVVASFKGRTARFDQLPYLEGDKESSTGDTLLQPLESKDSPLNTLRPGIHLHWELPDYFKKGIQSATSGQIIFPQVPNRWLVTRHLCKYDTTKRQWLPPASHSWIVESDYISESQPRDKDGFARTVIPVPLPAIIRAGEQPYRYMGRVVDIAEWPLVHPDDRYLKDFTGVDGQPCYLTALGFLGPAFSSYYPDCCSVFGFHDRFADETDICDAIRLAHPIQFKVGYHVVGWIDGDDPCGDWPKKIGCSYEQYVENCRQREEDVQQTPFDFFTRYASENYGWLFHPGSVSYELDSQHHLKTFKVPEKTLCNGILQEIVWDMLSNSGVRSFLGRPSGAAEPPLWKDDNIRLSIGNTSSEALAALLKADIQGSNSLKNQYETLLNLFQSGRIDDIEQGSNLFARLKQGLHADGFASEQGGLCWVIRKKGQIQTAAGPTKEIQLPQSLHRSLGSLNESQKSYDTSREALEVERKQFFMDWYRYIGMYVKDRPDYSVNLADLSAFIEDSFDYLTDRSGETGCLVYGDESENDEDNGVIHTLQKPDGLASSKASAVWICFEKCREELADYPEWELLAIPATIYRLPPDPVIAIEVDNLRCKLRNGDIDGLPVRVTTEIPDLLKFTVPNFTGTIEANDIIASFLAEANIPYREDIQLLAGEACLLIPSFAGEVASALARKGGSGNPASGNTELFRMAYTALLGGGSSLNAPDFHAGLFDTIREEAYHPVLNPSQTTGSAATALTAAFTNRQNQAWLMYPLGWNTQELYTGLHPKRYDPFLPLSIIWEAKLEPVKRDGGRQNYSPENLTHYFTFNSEATDYTYAAGIPITDTCHIVYTGSTLLMKKAIQSVTCQIEKYAAMLSDTRAREAAEEKIKGFKDRKIVSQTLSGFSANALLRAYIPPLPLVNLTRDMDVLTNEYIREGLSQEEARGDNWYAHAFHTEAPLSVGPAAQVGFCPLRSGFLSIESLEMIDIFGQRIRLSTPKPNSDGSLQLMPSTFLSPLPGEDRYVGKAYLPPRLVMPSRLLFKWLEAGPLAMPACGWILPNHLSDALFFYDSDGSAVGSFGIEHHTLRYRTRAGNRTNPSDSLEVDLGTLREPKVNPWLARFMRYIQRKSKGNEHFLIGLMRTILDSEDFISPEKKQSDGSLAVLTGRPLALARIALGIETYGAILPLNQSAMNDTDPWVEDVNNKQIRYADRMKSGDASLSRLHVPVRLGDRYDIDDGLIGYLLEANDDENVYGTEDFYAPGARTAHGVVHPPDTHILLCPNAEPQTLTVLIDPCADVHALTGVLPIASLEFPPDLFAETMKKLQMTFFTHPLLQQRLRFVVPLPEQKGYAWSWVTHRQDEEIPLPSPYSPEDISWGYTPQTLEEGWLKLSPDTDKISQ